MHRLILALSLALAACTAPSGSPTGVYRAAGTPIYSSAVLDSGRLAGRWQQAAAYGAPKGCRPGGVEITRRAGGLHAAFRLCASGREWRGAGALEPAGPGRFAIARCVGCGLEQTLPRPSQAALGRTSVASV